MKIQKFKAVDESHPASILVVDDEHRMLTSLEALLTTEGYQVTTSLGGLSACQLLLNQSFDLVLLDLNMGDLNGHQVMDFIAQHDIDIATIVVSGESSFSAVSQALRRGAYDYIKKPYDPAELISTIDKALQKVTLEKAHSAMQTRLKKSEELHRYIVNSSPDVVFMLDRKGHFSFLNRKVESLLGYSRKELLGKPYTAFIDPADLERAHFFFTEQPKRSSDRFSSELRLRFKHEAHASRHFEVTLFPVKSKSDQPGAAPRHMGLYGTARDITERKEAEQFINFQAYHDLLTRLPNRALFKDRLNLALAQSKRLNKQVAVMFLDLDRFKVVNDTLGHAMGDRLLQSVAMRLESCIRKGDTLSRFGGDEFTLLLPAIDNLEDARTIAKKVIDILKEPFTLGEHEVFVGVSIGITVSPEGGDTVEQMIQNADAAMYHVKGRGKDGYQFYNESLSVADSNRLNLERDIRLALERNEFVVYYQPKICTQSERVIGVEALVRWQHPERGIVYPSDFIPLAEETRLMSDISDWVLKKACQEVGEWLRSGHNHIGLSVNFSPLQVEHPKFVQRLLDTLEETGFPAENLEIELTEEVIMKDLSQMTSKLNQLAEHGVSVAIDDFGTGYSSLNYLSKLPINTLKVDQTFIREIDDERDEACIVNAIIAMAHGLKLNIVAEGVETRAQVDYLKSLGSHEMQGFYFGKAEPAEVTLNYIMNLDKRMVASC